METALLIFLPILAGLLIFIFDEAKAKYVALGAALIEFLVSLFVFIKFDPSSLSYVVNAPWIKSMGISFYVGMDGISLLLVILTTFLVPLIILSTFRYNYTKGKIFYSLVLIMQSALVGVFVARDAFLFYVFWEMALIPIYFICLLWGGQDKLRITFKFFIYTLAGSLFMLLGIIYIYLQTKTSADPVGSFSIERFYEVASQLDSYTQTWLFCAFFVAFAIKMPVFPFHTWQPDTYTIAPSPGTMLLSGIMLKMGIYGAIRWMIPIVPDAMSQWGHIAIHLSVAGIIYASVIALLQKDIKRLIAYVSIAHVGLMAAGVFTNSVEGIQGAMIQMLSHGITVVGLFFVVDIISDRTKTNAMASLGGIRNSAPVFSIFFMIILFASIALPLTSGFVGELMLFISLFKYNVWVAAVAGLTIILGAVYMLSSYQKIMLGESNTLTNKFSDLFLTEKVVLIPIIILIFWMGVYPKTFLDISEPAVKNLIENASAAYNLK